MLFLSSRNIGEGTFVSLVSACLQSLPGHAKLIANEELSRIVRTTVICIERSASRVNLVYCYGFPQSFLATLL